MCGDTPASNFVAGFKEGVGFSLRKCRCCLVTGDTISSIVSFERLKGKLLSSFYFI